MLRSAGLAGSTKVAADRRPPIFGLISFRGNVRRPPHPPILRAGMSHVGFVHRYDRSAVRATLLSRERRMWKRCQRAATQPYPTSTSAGRRGRRPASRFRSSAHYDDAVRAAGRALAIRWRQ